MRPACSYPCQEVATAKGIDPAVVQLITWRDGRSLQVLHVGPYTEESATYATIINRATELDLVSHGPAHEIYLSDPRRVAQDKLKTIIRLPVA